MEVCGYTVKEEHFASGNFGEILLACHPSNPSKEVVIKKIPREEKDLEAVKREIEAGKRLEHNNIVKFYHHFKDLDFHYLIFERVQGYDLFSYLEARGFVPFREAHARTIFVDILNALLYCHSKSVCHRDIKLENLLIHPNTKKVTLIDFGLCEFTEEGGKTARYCGSPDYVAPEVLLRKDYCPFAADTFSLGVCLYTLVFAEFPFCHKERKIAIDQGLEHPRITFAEKRLAHLKVSDSLKQLIQAMLEPNPARRIALKDIPNHPWLKNAPCSYPQV